MRRYLLNALIWLSLGSICQAETVRLKNGDILTGDIVFRKDKIIMMSHEALGIVEIKKDLIVEDKDLKKTERPTLSSNDDRWQKKLSGGYSQFGGNTKGIRGILGTVLIGKIDREEWTGKINAEYAASDHKMKARKFNGLLYHSHRFHEKEKWYFLQKLEGDQDRFANIEYRLIPSTGFGYWWSNTDSWKMMSEASVGYEYTHFRDDLKSSGEAKLIPRIFMEKTVIRNVTFNQEFVLYPSFKDVSDYRFRSQTGVMNKINQHCSLALRFLDEYNSAPTDNTFKNDYRLMSSIDYLF